MSLKSIKDGQFFTSLNIENRGASHRQIRSLDGLRGIAALVVVISHCANFGFLPAVLGNGFGLVGVGLFYALSGLLMARLYLNKPFQRDLVETFARRRAARVLPLFYAALCIGVLFVTVGLNPFRIETGQDIVAALFLVQGTGVLWSIPVEIQFYVLFLGLWWAHTKGYLPHAFVLLVAIQIVCVWVITSFFGLKIFTIFYWLHLFLMGTALGWLSIKFDLSTALPRLRPSLNLGCILVLLLLLLAPPGVRGAIGLPKTYAFADPIGAGLPMALLLAALLNLRPTQIFCHPVLVWLGGISFGLYLLHMPALVLVETYGGDRLSNPLGAVLIIAGSLGLATLSERHFERPVQRFILNRTRAKPHARDPA